MFKEEDVFVRKMIKYKLIEKVWVVGIRVYCFKLLNYWNYELEYCLVVVKFFLCFV